MSAKGTIESEVTNYIRILQNPYAKLSILPEDEKVETEKTAEQKKHAYFKNLQNPCAYDSLFAQEEFELPLVEKTDAASLTASSTSGISKKEFVDGCRRIFMQYVPPSEGKTLRPHYRDFVSRNENGDAGYRSRILSQLTRYDLSLGGNFKPHFNREKELLTAKKLKEIETKAKNG